MDIIAHYHWDWVRNEVMLIWVTHAIATVEQKPGHRPILLIYQRLKIVTVRFGIKPHASPDARVRATPPRRETIWLRLSPAAGMLNNWHFIRSLINASWTTQSANSGHQTPGPARGVSRVTDTDRGMPATHVLYISSHGHFKSHRHTSTWSTTAVLRLHNTLALLRRAVMKEHVARSEYEYYTHTPGMVHLAPPSQVNLLLAQALGLYGNSRNPIASDRWKCCNPKK